MKTTKMYFLFVLQKLPFPWGDTIPSWGLNQAFCLCVGTSPALMA